MTNATLAKLSVAAIATGSFICGTVAGIFVSERHKPCWGCPGFEHDDDSDICEDEETEEPVNYEVAPVKHIDAYKEQLDAYEKLTDIYKPNDSEEEKDEKPRSGRYPWGEDEEPQDPVLAIEQITDDIFVITQDAFIQNIHEMTQTTLVWYEEDETMVDSRDDILPWPEWGSMLTDKVLELFGHFTNDKDVVYIRNLSVNTEYEVIREHSSYAKSVLGVSPSDEEEYESAREFFKLDEKREEQR